jgi:hypothetical protein
MSILRDKALTILSLHRGGQQIKPRLDAHLEQLLGGSPVVLTKSPDLCYKPAPTVPSRVSDMNQGVR